MHKNLTRSVKLINTFTINAIFVCLNFLGGVWGGVGGVCADYAVFERDLLGRN